MEPHILRVIKEQRALNVRLNALANFIKTNAFKCLDDEERRLLGKLLVAMRRYNDVLKLRINKAAA